MHSEMFLIINPLLKVGKKLSEVHLIMSVDYYSGLYWTGWTGTRTIPYTVFGTLYNVFRTKHVFVYMMAAPYSLANICKEEQLPPSSSLPVLLSCRLPLLPIPDSIVLLSVVEMSHVDCAEAASPSYDLISRSLESISGCLSIRR